MKAIFYWLPLLLALNSGLPAARNVYVRAEEVEEINYQDEVEAEQAAEVKRMVPSSQYVVELDKPKLRNLLATQDDMLIEFYANWCSACHGLSPEFNDFAEAAHKQYPKAIVARANIVDVEYLSSRFMVSMLPQLVHIHRKEAGMTPEVRYVTANFTKSDLLDYIGGGWTMDQPLGGYRSLWCTPANLCGHVGGLIGEFVVNVVDQKLNKFNMPPWAFMALFVSAIYLVGQIVVGYLAGVTRRSHRQRIIEKEKKDHDTPKPVFYDQYRSDLVDGESDSKSSARKGSGGGTPTKRSKNKKSKRV